MYNMNTIEKHDNGSNEHEDDLLDPSLLTKDKSVARFFRDPPRVPSDVKYKLSITEETISYNAKMKDTFGGKFIL